MSVRSELWWYGGTLAEKLGRNRRNDRGCLRARGYGPCASFCSEGQVEACSCGSGVLRPRMPANIVPSCEHVGGFGALDPTNRMRAHSKSCRRDRTFVQDSTRSWCAGLLRQSQSSGVFRCSSSTSYLNEVQKVRPGCQNSWLHSIVGEFTRRDMDSVLPCDERLMWSL